MVAKAEFHAGELFPRVGFIVTNTQLRNRAVVRFYNQRGQAEQWIKEGKLAVKMTRRIPGMGRHRSVSIGDGGIGVANSPVTAIMPITHSSKNNSR